MSKPISLYSAIAASLSLRTSRRTAHPLRGHVCQSTYLVSISRHTCDKHIPPASSPLQSPVGDVALPQALQAPAPPQQPGSRLVCSRPAACTHSAPHVRALCLGMCQYPLSLPKTTLHWYWSAGPVEGCWAQWRTVLVHTCSCWAFHRTA